MQASNMGGAFHLLRSQSHLLNFSKIKFLPPQFSRHFLRPFHAETPVISHPPEPTLDPTPKTWSLSYSVPIRPIASDGEAEEAKKPILTENPLNPQPADPALDPTPKTWSLSYSAPIKPFASDGEAEEAKKSILTENPLYPQPAEPTLDPTPQTWSLSYSAPIKPFAGDGEAEEAKKSILTENPLNPQPAEPIVDPTPKTWSLSYSAPIKPFAGDGEAEEAKKSILTENPLNPQPAEPTLDLTPKTGPVFNSAPSRPIISDGIAEEAKKWANVGFIRSSVGNGNKGKGKMHWVCSDCGHSTAQWWGCCRSCKNVGTLKQFSVYEDVEGGGGKGFEASEKSMKSWLPDQKWSGPVRLSDVSRGMNHSDWRIYLPGTFGAEVARVLGGGVVPGSLILVGGDPGVGKSTLALQIAALIAESRDLGGAGPVIYISGEESIEQIGNRADRLSIGTNELFLYSGTDVEDILHKIQPLRPRAVVIDSIQTVYLKGVTGSAGGLMQLKECTSALLHFSKKTNVPVLLIGHVTKSGEIAGPRVLEHIVDVVLYMEGEKHSSHRLLRSVKNRFGSADELGVFEMLESGLQAVSNPSEMFLSEEHADSDLLAGLAVAVIIDGSRAFLIEVQALCVPGASVAKHVNGVKASRAEMIISVLKKQAGLKIEDSAVLLNVISGVTLAETAGDLAVAAAICSSSLEYPIPNNVAFIGEIGLAGELRMVPRIEKRVNTLAKLGYKMCVVPKSAEKTLAAIGYEGIQIVCCQNLKQVIDKVFIRR